MPPWVTIPLWIAAGFWLLGAIVWWRALRLVPDLPTGSPTTEKPRVSIIVAARDERARIETTARRILAQQGIDLQAIIVDDRSTDGTGEALRAIAADDHRLATLRIDALPEGWLGKCNALRAAAAQADGDWLLFTDADTWLAPNVAARAIAAAEAESAQHVCLMPGFHDSTFLGRATLLAFSLSFLKFMARANLDRPRSYVGVGAFNLVRADAYRAIGGHEPLRMEIVDDMNLGRLLRRAGFRTRCFLACRDCEISWGGAPRDILRILQKNHFAIARFNVWLVALILAIGATLWLAGVAGPLTGEWAGIAAGAAFWSVALPARTLARQHGWSWREALAAPPMMGLLIVSIANSAFTTLRAGGVRWRETFYPLADLRRGMIR